MQVDADLGTPGLLFHPTANSQDFGTIFGFFWGNFRKIWDNPQPRFHPQVAGDECRGDTMRARALATVTFLAQQRPRVRFQWNLGGFLGTKGLKIIKIVGFFSYWFILVSTGAGPAPRGPPRPHPPGPPGPSLRRNPPGKSRPRGNLG